MSRLREAAKILGFCVVCSVVFGVAHDAITVTLAKEYFTVHHPPVFRTENPALLALGWGIYATWWVGAGLGIWISICATVGSRPILTVRELARPIVFMLGIVLVASLAVLSFVRIVLPAVFAREMANVEPYDLRIMGSAMMHASSYLLGTIGGIGLGFGALWRRFSAKRKELRD